MLLRKHIYSYLEAGAFFVDEKVIIDLQKAFDGVRQNVMLSEISVY